MKRYTFGLFGLVGLAGAFEQKLTVFGSYLPVITVSFCSNITFAYSSDVPPLIMIQIRHLKYLKVAAGSKRILG